MNTKKPLMLLLSMLMLTPILIAPALATTVPLIAGQNEVAGSISVNVVGDNLVISIVTTGGWQITESHVYVGDTLPEKSAPGQFPYSDPDVETLTNHVYEIPLSEVGCGGKYVAVHAVVRKSIGCYWEYETAWGQGCPFGKGWAMYFTICIPCCT